MITKKKKSLPKEPAKAAKQLPEKIKKIKIDWEAIEREYRLGQKTMRVLAYEFGVNVSNISRRAKKESWAQDKSEEVRQRTNATLIAQQKRNTPSRDDIDKAVQTNIQIITSHRKDIQSTQSVVALLRDQLMDAAGSRESFGEMVEEEAGDNGNRRASFRKAISLPAHAGVVRDLAVAMKNLVGLERQAYNLDEKNPLDDLIEKIQLEFV